MESIGLNPQVNLRNLMLALGSVCHIHDLSCPFLYQGPSLQEEQSGTAEQAPAGSLVSSAEAKAES